MGGLLSIMGAAPLLRPRQSLLSLRCLGSLRYVGYLVYAANSLAKTGLEILAASKARISSVPVGLPSRDR